MLKEFLDMYNRGDIQLLSSPTSSSVEKRADGVDAKVERGVRGGQDKKGKGKGKGKDKKKRRKQYMSYTITTMTARDTSVENVARIKDLALDPLLAATSTSTDVVITDGSEGSANDVTFDRIVLMDPVVTCAEDLLELIFQSLLQDADVTCGMDFEYHSSEDVGGAAVAGSAEQGYTVANPGKLQDGGKKCLLANSLRIVPCRTAMINQAKKRLSKIGATLTATNNMSSFHSSPLNSWNAVYDSVSKHTPSIHCKHNTDIHACPALPCPALLFPNSIFFTPLSSPPPPS